MGISGGPDMIQDGLVLSLDASDRNSYVCGSTVWNDVSGNNKIAQLKNNPSFSTTNGCQFSLDGTDDYFYTSGTFTSYTNFTMVSWIRVSTVDNHRGIFCIKNELIPFVGNGSSIVGCPGTVILDVIKKDVANL
jgi:hypothetical protein